jgi:ubiquitin C-terminal hydrolase
LENNQHFQEKEKLIKDSDSKTDSEYLNELYEINKKEPPGLINLKGVCYMNAVLQCLYYCAPITKYFLTLDNDTQLGPVSKGYYNFIRGLFNGNKSAANSLRSAIIDAESSFAGTGGKDSKELILYLFSELNEELKVKGTHFQQMNIDKSNKLAVYNEKMQLDKMYGNIISKTFDFYVLLEYKCNNNYCNSQYSRTYYYIQNENVVNFELKNIVNQLNKVNANISLEECCLSYNKTEYTVCPFCKEKQLQIKKTIISLPDIFIFVMSRGKYAEYDCTIDFPIKINMGKCYTPIDKYHKESNTEYNLIGATFVYDWYKGNGHEGHTIAFCKTFKNGAYYMFNDRNAREANINEINGKVPYILFYERKKK